MKYISAKVFAAEQGISVRWVQELCKNGKITGASRLGGNGTWMIPIDAVISSSKNNLKKYNIQEEFGMVNAEKQMETGEKLLNEANLDMAAVYFEFAGEEFMRRKDYRNALYAYEKTLYCLNTDGKKTRIKEIEDVVVLIKKELEE